MPSQSIRRSWRKGDVAELLLPMPVRRVLAHASVMDDAGRVAIQRGPLVYCAEGIDNGGRAISLVIPEGTKFEPAGFPEGRGCPQGAHGGRTGHAHSLLQLGQSRAGGNGSLVQAAMRTRHRVPKGDSGPRSVFSAEAWTCLKL